MRKAITINFSGLNYEEIPQQVYNNLHELKEQNNRFFPTKEGARQSKNDITLYTQKHIQKLVSQLSESKAFYYKDNKKMYHIIDECIDNIKDVIHFIDGQLFEMYHNN